jgi:hypothetical protein
MTICSGTQITCFMPSRFKASGISLWPVPWKGVYTILKVSATASTAPWSLTWAITLARNFSSVSEPMMVMSPPATDSS